MPPTPDSSVEEKVDAVIAAFDEETSRLEKEGQTARSIQTKYIQAIYALLDETYIDPDEVEMTEEREKIGSMEEDEAGEYVAERTRKHITLCRLLLERVLTESEDRQRANIIIAAYNAKITGMVFRTWMGARLSNDRHPTFAALDSALSAAQQEVLSDLLIEAVRQANDVRDDAFVTIVGKLTNEKDCYLQTYRGGAATLRRGDDLQGANIEPLNDISLVFLAKERSVDLDTLLRPAIDRLQHTVDELAKSKPKEEETELLLLAAEVILRHRLQELRRLLSAD